VVDGKTLAVIRMPAEKASPLLDSRVYEHHPQLSDLYLEALQDDDLAQRVVDDLVMANRRSTNTRERYK
jgi:hypothetical protein